MRALLATLALSAAAALELNGWYPCELTKDAAQCAVFKAPLCAGCNRALDVFVKRLAAPRRSAATPSVVMVQGGPGAQPLDMEAAMRSIWTALGGDVDVYSLDRRGSGRSTKLDCVAAQAQDASSPGGVAISPEEVASCADELGSKYAGDLSVFSVTSAARDVQYFIENVLNGTSATFVYGAGPHSAIVERLIHLDTPRSPIHGYILDGVATTAGSASAEFPYLSKWDVAYDGVGQEFLSLCARDSDYCSKYFPGTTAASEALRSLVQSLDSPGSDCAVALDSQLAKVFGYEPGEYLPAQAFRWAMGELLRRSSLRKFIPVVTYRLARCTTDDAKVLSHFFEMLAKTLSSEQDTARSSLLAKLVAFSEFWEAPTPTQETMDARFRAASLTTRTNTLQMYCAFTKDNASACSPFAEYTNYTAAPLAYEKDAYWNIAATPRPNASVLLLSGTLDPLTPHKHAQALFSALNTTNKKLVAFEHGTHGALWTSASLGNGTTCGVAVLASFVRSQGNLSETNTSCVPSKASPFSFVVEKRVVANWLNTSNAYDGAFVTSNATSSGIQSALASPYKLAIIALCVLLGLACVLACVVVTKWRRGKKTRRGSTFCVDDPAYDEFYT